MRARTILRLIAVGLLAVVSIAPHPVGAADDERFAGTMAEASDLTELVGASDYEPTVQGPILRLYHAFFNREPDIAGAKYWIDVNAQGRSLDDIAEYFTLSEEFSNNYEGTTDTEYLTAVYEVVLSRDYDQIGFNYWLGLLTSEQLTRGGVVRWIAANVEFVNAYPYGPGPLGDGSLGVVAVDAGARIQIRSLNTRTGDVAFLGRANEAGIDQALIDYGPIHGFNVYRGAGLDDFCSPDGGQAAGQNIAADKQVIGVIGTSCSNAATTAAPLITDAGMVMISGSNTSPALTSDQHGNPGANYDVGYYRTSENDLSQGVAMAQYVFDELGFTTAAAIHAGDPYTESLARAFLDAFVELGGEITGFSAVVRGDTNLVPVLIEIGAGLPQALFFPVFQPEGDFIAAQAPGVSDLEDTVLLAADGLLVDGFLELEQSEGVRISGPDNRFGTNRNQRTGVTAEMFLANYESKYGEAPSAPSWAHSYDATVMLLDAIEASSWLDGGTLMIDRAGVREHLNSIRDFSGISGTIACDSFGDCGSQKMTIIEHLSSANIEASKNNVVYEYAP